MNDTAARPQETRADYPYVREISTRFADYDMLRHLNNVEYYRYFEYIILDFLDNIGTDWLHDPVIPLVVESGCHFRLPIRVARAIDAGLRIARIGSSSVRYEIGLFEKDREEPSASGFFVHVYLDRDSEKPTPVPEGIRPRLQGISVSV